MTDQAKAENFNYVNDYAALDAESKLLNIEKLTKSGLTSSNCVKDFVKDEKSAIIIDTHMEKMKTLLSKIDSEKAKYYVRSFIESIKKIYNSNKVLSTVAITAIVLTAIYMNYKVISWLLALWKKSPTWARLMLSGVMTTGIIGIGILTYL